jgi:hypothetical protein
VFDKYSQMKSAIEGEAYNERGNVWGAFADLVDELPDVEETTSPSEEPMPEPTPPSVAEVLPTAEPAPAAEPEAPSLFGRLADAIGLGDATKTDSGTPPTEPSPLNNPKMERALSGISAEQNQSMLRGEYVPPATTGTPAETESDMKRRLDELRAALGMTPGEIAPKEEQNLMSMRTRGVPDEVLKGKVESLKRGRSPSMAPTAEEQPPLKMSRGE